MGCIHSIYLNDCVLTMSSIKWKGETKWRKKSIKIILKDSLYHKAGGVPVADHLPVTKAVFTQSGHLFQPPTTHHFPPAHAFLRSFHDLFTKCPLSFLPIHVTWLPHPPAYFLSFPILRPDNTNLPHLIIPVLPDICYLCKALPNRFAVYPLADYPYGHSRLLLCCVKC